MSLAKRIIPCLDVDNGRVVKGVKFVNIRDAGDPVEIAKRYDEQGADEITFLDITASAHNRETMVHVVEAVAGLGEALVPVALEALADELADTGNPNRLQAALGLLKLVPLAVASPTGSTDQEEIVRLIVEDRRRNAHSPLEDMINTKGLPPFDDHGQHTWDELEAKLKSAINGPSSTD